METLSEVIGYDDPEVQGAPVVPLVDEALDAICHEEARNPTYFYNIDPQSKQHVHYSTGM